LLEGELGSWKQTNRYRRITFGSEAAGRRARKRRSDKRISNFGGGALLVHVDCSHTLGLLLDRDS
jgi:hypothetical protein